MKDTGINLIHNR